jgi:hypothetical protein
MRKLTFKTYDYIIRKSDAKSLSGVVNETIIPNIFFRGLNVLYAAQLG